MRGSGAWLAVSAGCLAATAGVFGKLAGSAISAAIAIIACYTSLIIVRLSAACIVATRKGTVTAHWLMMIREMDPISGLQCNVGMTTLHIKSLQTIPSLQATVLSVATNICLTVWPSCTTLLQHGAHKHAFKAHNARCSVSREFWAGPSLQSTFHNNGWQA